MRLRIIISLEFYLLNISKSTIYFGEEIHDKHNLCFVQKKKKIESY